jgi:AAA domain, putative AbiEii toxin, Type IV TA system
MERETETEPQDNAASPAGPVRRLVRPCRLIKSDRLDALAELRRPVAVSEAEDAGAERRIAVERIAASISKRVRDARERSRSRASTIDGSFFDRSYKALSSPVPLSSAERQGLIQQLEQLHARLKACALATSELALPAQPSQSAQSPAAQSLLDLYLQDMLDKSTASEPDLLRLELFCQTLNAHLVEKRVDLDLECGMRVCRDADGNEIQLGKLSSGEQHLIVLFYYLVFLTEPNGICLIDEPEISLNVDWQHRFIDTVSTIGRIAPQQFVIATHSPVVVSNHEDLLRPVARVG